MVIVDHEISRAEEWGTKTRNVIFVDVLEAVDLDYDFGAIRYDLLAFGIDFDIWYDKLVVWNSDIQIGIYRYGKISFIPACVLAKLISNLECLGSPTLHLLEPSLPNN